MRNVDFIMGFCTAIELEILNLMLSNFRGKLLIAYEIFNVKVSVLFISQSTSLIDNYVSAKAFALTDCINLILL